MQDDFQNHSPLSELAQSLRIIEQHITKGSTRKAECLSLDAEMSLRRKRNRIFPVGYFADAGWEILLDLYKAQLDDYRCCITDLGLGAAVPQTTMLRYVAKLQADGMIERVPDAYDRRRVYIVLTPDAIQRMAELFGPNASIAEKESNVYPLPTGTYARGGRLSS